MKILMTLMGLEIGGAETHVVELARELHKQGHEVIVASNGGVYEANLQQDGIRHYKIPMHRRDAGMMLRSLKLLRQVITSEKPDLVHAHARIPAFLCGILQKQLKFPFITSAHWVFEVTPMLQAITNWGQRTVAVSEDIKKYLMVNYGVPADQIHVTINGIDTEQFAPGAADAQLKALLGIGNGPVIGTVSRLDESRELASRYLIRVMPQVLEVYPDAQLLIVGGGNQEQSLRAEAEAVNRQFGRNAIIMTGPRTDISRLVSLCDIFAGVSRAALEAMAAEKPTVLAGNEGYIGIFREDVLACAQDSNFCCRGCPEMTPQMLLEDLLQLLRTDAAGREQLGRFGRQVVLEQYSVARMTKDYLLAYEQLLHPRKVIRAAISGYYGFGNLGDDSILVAADKQLSQMDPPVQLTVLSGNPELTTGHYGLRAVHRFAPLKVLRTLKQSDLVISGGGSLLQDKTSTRSLMYYLSVVQLAKAMKKPVFMYANGIGPVIKPANRRRVRNTVSRFDMVTLRDEASAQELKALGVEQVPAFVTGDPAFLLEAGTNGPELLARFGVPQGKPIVGISVRDLPGGELKIGPFVRLCDRISKETGRSIVFIVMQESEDEAVSRQIMEQMEEPSYLIKAPGDPAGMLAMIRQMELVISMRLHTIIFSANMQVPVVGCVYDPKVSAFLELLQMPSCGTPQQLDPDAAFGLVSGMLEQPEFYRQQLASQDEARTAAAQQTAVHLQELISAKLKKG